MPADPLSDSPASNSLRQPTATILIVDDDRDTVESTASLLRIANYNVICTYCVQEAVDVLHEHSEVGLVLSDIRMPEYSGFDLYSVMRYRWPKLPIVLVTGFEIADLEEVPRGAVIVRKPYMLRQLDEAIKAQLFLTRHGGVPARSA